MGKLRVHRKGYAAKRDKTTYRVEPTSFLIKDRGKPGRTPKSKRWYKPTTEMGWEKDMPMAKRRRLALRAHGGDALATGRALQALSNVTTDRETKTKSRADALYFFKKHKAKA